MKLKDSGYSAHDRREVIKKAKQIFQPQCERDQNGIKPLFRPREMILEDRKAKKGKKYSWWKIKDKYNAIMFVPPTPSGILLKMLRARAESLLADLDLNIRFVEQGGIKIKNLLVKATPFLPLTTLMLFDQSVRRRVSLNLETSPPIELLVQPKDYMHALQRSRQAVNL